MKILHYLPVIDLAEGGVVRAVLDLCAITAAAGHEVVFVTRQDKDAPAHMKAGDGPARVHVLPAPRGRAGSFSAAERASVEPLVAQADILHLHVPWIPANLQLARMARRHGKPYVMTIHGMLDDWAMSYKGIKKNLYLALMGRRLVQNASAIHFSAQAELTQSRPRLSARLPPLHVIPLIFDFSEYRTLPGPESARTAFALDDSRPNVLFLSRLHPVKRPEILIDAAARLKEQGTPIHLLLAGVGEPSYVESLRSRVTSAGLTSEDVRFLGLVTGSLKISLYQAADIFALPTKQENFGFVVPEALACATPAIATRGMDIWPELDHSGGAVVADPPTPETFARIISELAGDASRRRAMGEAGREWVFDFLNPDNVLIRFEQMYHSVRPQPASGMETG